MNMLWATEGEMSWRRDKRKEETELGLTISGLLWIVRTETSAPLI